MTNEAQHDHMGQADAPILSPTAARRVMSAAGEAPALLRLQVVSGGCQGFQVTFALETDCRPEDLVTETNGVRLVTDRLSASYFRHALVDWQEDLAGGRLHLLTDQTSGRCGCGSSFSFA